MALPILDGNQSATTLSTILSSGQHITAHTVVSLGTQAVTDISTAVGLLQSAVATQGSVANTAFVKIGGHTGTATTGNIVHVSSVGAMKVDASASTQPISGTVTIGGGTVTIGAGTAQIGSVTASMQAISILGVAKNLTYQDIATVAHLNVAIGKAVQLEAGTNQIGSVTASISGTVPISISSVTIGNSVTVGSLPTISGTVTVGNSVTVGSLPVQLSTTTIGGTARLNVTLSSATTIGATAPSYGNLYGGSDGTNFRAILVDSSGRTTVTGSVSILGTPSVTMGAIFGTVTANIGNYSSQVTGYSGSPQGTVTAMPVALVDRGVYGGGIMSYDGTNTSLNVNIKGTVPNVTISAQPSGALTTRFGSVTTANTAQITTAVTNTSRKYLLAQNISTGTVTIGIGFAPTTTQGIQLTAGAGLTFDAFTPTGAIYWLSSVTGSNFSILEG
jgi:hypothetical protein